MDKISCQMIFIQRISSHKVAWFDLWYIYKLLTIEPGYSISYEIACVPSENSDLFVQPYSLFTLQGTQWVGSDPKLIQVDSNNSDQTVQMSRLIWVFAEHTCSLVGNAVPQLEYEKKKKSLQMLFFCFVFFNLF